MDYLSSWLYGRNPELSKNRHFHCFNWNQIFTYLSEKKKKKKKHRKSYCENYLNQFPETCLQFEILYWFNFTHLCCLSPFFDSKKGERMSHIWLHCKIICTPALMPSICQIPIVGECALLYIQKPIVWEKRTFEHHCTHLDYLSYLHWLQGLSTKQINPNWIYLIWTTITANGSICEQIHFSYKEFWRPGFWTFIVQVLFANLRNNQLIISPGIEIGFEFFPKRWASIDKIQYLDLGGSQNYK